MSSKDAIVKRRQGILFVVSAPSGAGKTSLCQELVSQLPDLRYSVSYTSRKPRPAEIADRHYHFVDEATFRDMIKEAPFWSGPKSTAISTGPPGPASRNGSRRGSM